MSKKNSIQIISVGNVLKLFYLNLSRKIFSKQLKKKLIF